MRLLRRFYELGDGLFRSGLKHSGFFLPVRVLSRLFHGVSGAIASSRMGRVYSKRPFGGPEAVLTHLSRYTHRVATSNSRLITLDNAVSHSSGKTTAPMDADGPR